MHGEYKVPGGKLVVVDVESDGERITAFRLSGDFFLEPDDALEQIDAAVLGQPATATAAEIGTAIREGLPEGVTMLGLTPEAVGVAG